MSFLQKVILKFKEVDKYFGSDAKIIVVAIFVMVVFPAAAAQVEKPVNINEVTVISSEKSSTLHEVVLVNGFQSAEVEIQGKDTIITNSAKQGFLDNQNDPEVVAELVEEELNGFDPTLPFGYKIAREVRSEVSGYNPVPEQTDSTPCTTASGKNICEREVDVVAANWLKFGAKVRIPEYFGDRIFTVEDRMNTRYPYNTDVLFYDKQQAREFGRRTLVIQILEEVDVQLAQK